MSQIRPYSRVYVRLMIILWSAVCFFSSFAAFADQLSFSAEEQQWLAKYKTLRIGITPDWPPFEFIDKDGKYKGLSADFARHVAEKLNIELQIVSSTDPWSIVLQKLKNGELDAVASIFISDSRKEYINFTEPYINVPHLLIAREGAGRYERMEDLNGKTLAYMRGWVCQELVERDFPLIKLNLSDTIEGMIGQVLLGTSDAGLIDMASLSYYSKMHNLSGLRVAFQSPYQPSLAFGFPSHDKTGAVLFDKVLKSLSSDLKNETAEKWLGGDDSFKRYFRRILQWILLILVVTGIVLVWNFQLRRQVKIRTDELVKEIDHNRLQAEALRESEGKIRAFFDQTLQFIGLLTTDGVLLEANKSSLELINITSSEVIGVSFWETPWWKHSPELQSRLKKAISKAADGKIVRFETTHRDSTGKMFYVDFSLKPFHDINGEIVYLIAEGRDITSQHESLQSLKESEERFRLIFESSPDPCWLIQDGQFIECNVAAGALFGLTQKEAFIGKHPGLFSPEYQPDGRKSSEAANEKMTLAFRDGVARFEWEHLHSDGHSIPMEITLSPITLNGNPALYCLGRDLTDKRKAENERRRLEEQFMQAQKMESIGRLAGGVAHDFNNLLTAIRGFTELILMHEELPDRVREMMGEIDRAGVSATSLTRQLLAFSRKQIFQPKIIDANRLITDLQKLLQRLIGEDITLQLNLSEKPVSCFADPGQLEQILVNLVVNGRDAMPEGGEITIETAHVIFDDSLAELHSPLTPGSYLMIAVSDNGMGMTAEVKQRIFEPFFTTKEHGKGTGLGLATVYGIVRQSGGNVIVYSELGHGTTFRIYLPSGKGEIESVTADKPAPVRGKNQLVMIIEDDEILRILMTQGLPAFGYRVIAFASGDQAMDYINSVGSEIPAAVVTDIVMPGVKGPEIAEKLVLLKHDLPVLFISGYTFDNIVKNGMLPAAVNFLAKPFTITSLAEKIGCILKHH